MFMGLTAYKNYKAKFSWKKWTINPSLKVIKVEVLKYKKITNTSLFTTVLAMKFYFVIAKIALSWKFRKNRKQRQKLTL